MQISQDVIDRFLSKVNVDQTSGCWEWTGSKTPKGYGRISFNQVSGGTIYAHRLSYLIYKGEIPAGMFVCHACDNPGCVNPNHLWVGTGQDNALDRESKHRRVAVKGAASHLAKLSDDDVRLIRVRAATKEFGIQTRLAREYGVCRRTIVSIVAGETWQHLK